MSGKKDENAVSDGYGNTFWNVLAPLSEGGKYAQGSVTYVAWETFVGYLIRKLMKAPTQTMESAEAHLYSLPMIGMLNFSNEKASFKLGKNDKVEITDEMAEGAKAIPGFLAGYTAMKLRREGVKIPSYANRDVLYGIMGKMISRVLMSYLITNLPEDLIAGQQTLISLFNRYKAVINAKKQAASAKDE